jgi:dual oxidase
MKLHNNTLDNVDVWVGGILETDKGPGELFTKIIKDQFTRIRDGDRFWYKNTNNRYVINTVSYFQFKIIATYINIESLKCQALI